MACNTELGLQSQSEHPTNTRGHITGLQVWNDVGAPSDQSQHKRWHPPHTTQCTAPCMNMTRQGGSAETTYHSD
eukprot:2568796-Amphidinium_carterae.1